MRLKKIKASIGAFFFLVCAKIAIAAPTASDIFGDTTDKASDIRDVLIGEVAVTLAAIVWIIFFIGMMMGKASKEFFVKLTIACIGIGATGAIVDFLMTN